MKVWASKIIFMSSRTNLYKIMIQDTNFIAKKSYSLRKLKHLIIIMPSRFQFCDLKLSKNLKIHSWRKFDALLNIFNSRFNLCKIRLQVYIFMAKKLHSWRKFKTLWSVISSRFNTCDIKWQVLTFITKKLHILIKVRLLLLFLC